MEVRVIMQGEVIHTRVLGDRALHLGRSSANDLVLTWTDVSGHHAVLYREGDDVLIKDLASSNGTFLNGEPIRTPVSVQPGDVLRFGATATVELAQGLRRSRPAWRLERASGGVGWPVRGVLQMVDHEDVALVPSGDALWLAVDGEQTHKVEADIPFTVDGLDYVLRVVDESTAETVRPNASAYPYELDVDLDEECATITDIVQSKTCEVRTGNRVALLYALAERWDTDGPGPGRGWMDDADLAVAVWGRAHRDQGANNLHVLVHRVRSDLAAAGLERWCIEKRRGRTRIQVLRVTLR